MADGHGGPRPADGKPRPPAGPGKYSQRTDLSQPPGAQGTYAPTGLPYGEATAARRAMQAAPLPANRGTPAPAPTRASPARQAPAGQPAGPPPDIWSILARPTNRPDEPLTAGLPVGAGINQIISGLTPGGGPPPDLADLERMRPVMPTLEAIANLPDSSDFFRAKVRELRGMLRMP
jgi:hypothetical protein